MIYGADVRARRERALAAENATLKVRLAAADALLRKIRPHAYMAGMSRELREQVDAHLNEQCPHGRSGKCDECVADWEAKELPR